MKAKIYVTLKSAVLDPQGQAVQKTLSRLGFDEVDGVRIGKYIELDLKGEDKNSATARLEEMCKRLLCNTVIESYRIEVG